MKAIRAHSVGPPTRGTASKKRSATKIATTHKANGNSSTTSAPSPRRQSNAPGPVARQRSPTNRAISRAALWGWLSVGTSRQKLKANANQQVASRIRRIVSRLPVVALARALGEELERLTIRIVRLG